MRKEVIGLGALNYDVLYVVERIASGGEEVGIIDVKKVPGGSAANTSVALSRLGVDVGFVGVVGNDEEGELILEEFRKERVETRIRKEEGYTGAAIGFIDAQGERALYIHPGVNDKLCMANIDMEFVDNAKFLHTSSFVNTEQLEMQCELAKRIKSKLSFSPGMLCFKYELEDLAELIERSEVVFLSLKELKSLIKNLSFCGAPPHDPASPVRAYKKALPKKYYSLDSIKREDYERGAEALLNTGAKIVCVTLGEKGCYVTNSTDESHLIAACPTDVVDTTGAGDAFAAGFLYALLHEKGIYESGKMGNLVASFCIREYGCRKGLPYKLSLDAMSTN
jgi:ribokinase